MTRVNMNLQLRLSNGVLTTKKFQMWHFLRWVTFTFNFLHSSNTLTSVHNRIEYRQQKSTSTISYGWFHCYGKDDDNELEGIQRNVKAFSDDVREGNWRPCIQWIWMLTQLQNCNNIRSMYNIIRFLYGLNDPSLVQHPSNFFIVTISKVR